MNLIQLELKKAQSKMLAIIPGTDLVVLSSDNVAIVEAMIQNDSAYLKSSDKTAVPTSKYGGSTAYWMTKLKTAVQTDQLMSEEDYACILIGAIAAVDRENSTHLNADGVGREEIVNRLRKIDKRDLVYYLKKPEETNLRLFSLIAEQTHPKGESPKGNAYKPRTNVSFASKFCHYACFYLFEGDPEQDNFSIYDDVLKKALPRYIKHYGVQKRDINDYWEYRKTVDEIIEKSGAGISRNGFDHLLWYYFKGRL